jgi:hypothetical protein
MKPLNDSMYMQYMQYLQYLGFSVEAHLLQLCLNGLPCLKALHAAELTAARRDETLVGENCDEIQTITLPALVVVGIVPRRDFHRSRSKVSLHEGIRYDGQPAIQERVAQQLPMQMGVTRILGMDSHRRVAQHGLQTGGCHHNLLLAALHLVGEGDEHPEFNLVLVARDGEEGATGQFHLLYLDVGDGGAECAGPVNQPVGSINTGRRLTDEFILSSVNEIETLLLLRTGGGGGGLK